MKQQQARHGSLMQLPSNPSLQRLRTRHTNAASVAQQHRMITAASASASDDGADDEQVCCCCCWELEAAVGAVSAAAAAKPMRCCRDKNCVSEDLAPAICSLISRVFVLKNNAI
jgi:hypothetical protein